MFCLAFNTAVIQVVPDCGVDRGMNNGATRGAAVVLLWQILHTHDVRHFCRIISC